MQDEMQQNFPALIQDATLIASSVRASKQQMWMSLREEIYRLYITEDRSLKEVMRIIYEVHDFNFR
jgi:hypothetical protein